MMGRVEFVCCSMALPVITVCRIAITDTLRNFVTTMKKSGFLVDKLLVDIVIRQERNAAKRNLIKPRRFFPIVRGIPLWFFCFMAVSTQEIQI
jgi:hypothetical protein